MAARNLAFSTVTKVIVTITIVLIVLAYFIRLNAGSDPADRVAVLRIVSDGASRRHAVVYRYHHANSSSEPIAVWIMSGDLPDMRPEHHPDGSPSLVWTGAAESLSLTWSEANRALLAAVYGRADIRSGSRFQDCYFNKEGETDLLCF
ncbi:MAG: hypothetical protein ABWY18_01160, partial [Tardiphaga sp.]